MEDFVTGKAINMAEVGGQITKRIRREEERRWAGHYTAVCVQ